MANGLLQTSPGGLLSGIRERMQRFSADPLAMASLALALQPRRRPVENTGLEAILGGMQAANRNQYFQQAASEMEAQQQARQQQAAATEAMLAQLPPAEQAMARAMGPDFLNYKMKMIEFQQKIAEQAAAEEQKKQQAQAMQNFMGTLPPEQAALAAAMGPAFLPQYAKSIFAQPSETTLQKNLVAAGLQPGSREYQAQMMQAIQRPSVQIDMGEKMLTPAELAKLQTPEGEVPPVGTTYQSAMEAGMRPRIPPSPAEAEKAKLQARAAAKEELSSRGVSSAVSDMYSTVDAFRQDPTNPETYAAMQQNKRRLAQMLAQKRNPGRAPTDADVRIAMQDIPDPVSVGQVGGMMLGGDVWSARMKVLEAELGTGETETAAGTKVKPNFNRVPSVDDLLKKYK